MNKTKKTKNLLILIVLLAIVAIAVGYAALAQDLTLNGTVKTLSKEDWDVHFETDTAQMIPDSDIEHDNVYDQEISLSELTGTFKATLAPGASIDYIVSIVNDGKIHAKSSGAPTVTGTDDVISCSVTQTASDGELYDGYGKDTYKVTVSCSDTLLDAEKTANIDVTFNYVQAH